MAGRSRHAPVAPNVHLQPAVHGLDVGRSHARRAQRRRHRRNRFVTTLVALVVVGAIGAAGWLGYTAYVEHDSNEQLENDRRVAERERARQGRTPSDIIEQLEDQPAWNGPGNPTFGVGSGGNEP